MKVMSAVDAASKAVVYNSCHLMLRQVYSISDVILSLPHLFSKKLTKCNLYIQ